MEIVLLPSAFGLPPELQYLSTYVIDGVLAIDAGSLGFGADLASQCRIRDVILTHSHLDHIASLPVFLENVYGSAPPVTIHASQPVIDCLRQDLFNNRVYPDLFTNPPPGPPWAHLHVVDDRQSYRLGEYEITFFEARHTVPTYAVLIRKGRSAILIATDTQSCDKLNSAIQGIPELQAILLEVAFPKSMQWLADLSGHMTTADMDSFCRNCLPNVPVYAIHLKPRFYQQVREEIETLNLPHLAIMQPGVAYRIPSNE